MQAYFTFCLMFLIFPLALSALMSFHRLLTGPRDSSEYHLQTYQEISRQAIIQILVIDMILLGIALLYIQISYTQP
jgi:ABC-type sugar transport system permease subunit